MSVYINMEMPQKTYAHCMLIKDIDGSVQLLVCTKNSGEISEWESYDLVPVPPHGRLIDADELYEHAKLRSERFNGCFNDLDNVINALYIEKFPTIIQAEEGE